MADKILKVDEKIRWVKQGKSGTFKDKKTGEPRPWQIWDFRIEGDEKYYSWFEKSGEPIPCVGAYIKGMEGEVTTYQKNDGSTGYNNKINYIAYHDDPPNIPNQTQGYVNTVKSTQSAPASTGGTIRLEGLSFYVSYAKDLMVAAMSLNADYGQRAVDALAAEVVEIGKDMCRSAMEIPEPDKEPEPYKPTLGPGDDYPPIGDPPPF